MYKFKPGTVLHRSQQTNGQIENLKSILTYCVLFLCFFLQKHKIVRYHYTYGILFAYFFKRLNNLRLSFEKDCLNQNFGTGIEEFENCFMYSLFFRLRLFNLFGGYMVNIFTGVMKLRLVSKRIQP